ncbi:hypothetical protein C8R47DRAFT_466 [Mycena vitilis]|nr:hypothetical protein C8R47DRAFT_466 [Mycena vitilis]
MRFRVPRSPDPEKHGAETDHGPVHTPVTPPWPPLPAALHLPKNDTKNNHGLFTRIFASIFPLKSRITVPDEKHPESQGLEWDSPPYSEAESRQASAKLWSIYVGEAERYDKALVESWKADMEGMLIFSGLFSASLTAFLVESYQTLQPDSGAAAVQLLTQISQQLAAPSANSSLASLDDSEFRATTSSLVCNTLWFISLTLSITCALLATLVEQWAREFLHRTEKHPSPIRRARVFSFLYFGVRRFGMHVVVDLIPLLLHVALILFLAGLVAFLVPINEFLMGLIGAILGVFLAIYAVITLLPVISSDCPYRTPFSAFAWRLIQPARKLWLGSAAPDVEANLNDVMLDMALQKSHSRDQRAIAWTVDSLTDEAELLPFLEAIPEAVYGHKGFHLLNDHMFISALNGLPNQESLGARITSLMLSTRNRKVEDPLRQRGLIAGLKAIWALGMISDRSGRFFVHGESCWFPQEARATTISPFTPFLRELQQPDFWPEPIASAATFAVDYSNVNHVRNRLSSVACLAQKARRRDPDFVSAVAALLPLLRELSFHYHVPRALKSHTASLRSWVSSSVKDTSKARAILLSMAEDNLWLMVNVAVLTSYLRIMAQDVSEGLELPYEYEATCCHVVPRIPLPPDTVQMIFPSTPAVQSSPFVEWSDSTLRAFDPGTSDEQRNEILPLDRIMSCFFRLLPLLKLEDVMPIFTTYLAKRNHADPICSATQHCPGDFLLDCLVAMLGSPTEADNALRAICATLVRINCEAFDWWHEREDRIYDFMTARGIFASPKFLCLSSMIRMRKLSCFKDRARYLLHLEPDDDQNNKPRLPSSQGAMDRAFHEWRTLIAHPFLQSAGRPEDTTITQNSKAEELIADIHTRARRSIVICVTEFTVACLDANDQPYLAETMQHLCDDNFGRFGAVEADIMVGYANAWLDLLNHCISSPQNLQLRSTARALFLQRRIQNDPELLSHQLPAASIFKDALTRYIQFLQDNAHSDAHTMEQAKQILSGLPKPRMEDS